MSKKMLWILLFILISGLGLKANAVTPEWCCQQHEEQKAEGDCSTCGTKCIKVTITNNTGLTVTIYKKAEEAQCSITNSCKTDCPECDCTE